MAASEKNATEHESIDGTRYRLLFQFLFLSVALSSLASATSSLLSVVVAVFLVGEGEIRRCGALSDILDVNWFRVFLVQGFGSVLFMVFMNLFAHRGTVQSVDKQTSS
jgi:hypothetical protein